MCFGGSQDKDNMGWWLLKGFEQGIRGAVTEHVDFVNDIDLVAGLVGGIVYLLTEAANIINAGVTGGINFDNIEGSSLAYCLAHGAGIARFPVTVGETVHRLGQNARCARLTGSSWATEKIGMRDATAAECVA